MKGIKFGNKHSYNDFGLILSSKEIGVPSVKTNTVAIEGADGILDLTESLSGRPTYENRTLSFTFSVIDPEIRWLTTFSKVMNYLHGQNMKVILDEDSGFFYIGRVSVNSIQSNKTVGTIVIDFDAEPFKYSMQSSEEDWKWDTFRFTDGYIQKTVYNVNGSLDVTIKHQCKIVVPEFVTSGPMTITFKGKTYSITGAGTYKNYEILFEDGDNPITFTGSGTVTVRFRGSSL